MYRKVTEMMNSCSRCGYEWAPRSKDPIRCPSCKSTRWNRKAVNDRCLRCGAEWVQRGTVPPKYCPVCHSSMWNTEKITYTCPKCGLSRTLRSNSRIGLCPACDRYVDSKPRTKFEEYRQKESGISEVVRIWSDGEGLTLTYVDNGRNMAYLYADGDLVGSVNFASWCRNNKLSMEFTIKNHKDDSVSEKLSMLAMTIMSEDEHSADRSAAIAELRDISEEKAKILELYENGMEPLPISLKLGVPFSEVMEAVNSIPPISGKSIGQSDAREDVPELRSEPLFGSERT